MDQQDLQYNRLHLNYYTSNNKADALLARQFKSKESKARTAYIQDPQTGGITNPQHIVNSFAQYYARLYSVKDDASTSTAFPVDIKQFLQKS